MEKVAYLTEDYSAVLPYQYDKDIKVFLGNLQNKNQ